MQFGMFGGGGASGKAVIKLAQGIGATALAAINEKQSACAAWNKLIKTYPSANKRLLSEAKGELSKLNCS